MITRRKALARSTKPLKRTPIRRVSKRRRADIARYTVLRAKFLAMFPWCQVSIDAHPNRQDLWEPSREVHHRRGRGRYYLDASTWMPVARSAHAKIHRCPSWARNMGYIL